jgi:hypothetical protein
MSLFLRALNNVTGSGLNLEILCLAELLKLMRGARVDMQRTVSGAGERFECGDVQGRKDDAGKGMGLWIFDLKMQN